MPGIIALCCAYVFSQFFRSFLAVLTPVLSSELGMTPTEFAYASGAWFVMFTLANTAKLATYFSFLGNSWCCL